MKKFIWPSQEQIDYLKPHIDIILDALADVCETPGMKQAYVSDESCLDHFLIMVKRHGGDHDEAVRRLSSLLGVKVVGTERLTEVARQMAGLI